MRPLSRRICVPLTDKGAVCKRFAFTPTCISKINQWPCKMCSLCRTHPSLENQLLEYNMQFTMETKSNENWRDTVSQETFCLSHSHSFQVNTGPVLNFRRWGNGFLPLLPSSQWLPDSSGFISQIYWSKVLRRLQVCSHL